MNILGVALASVPLISIVDDDAWARSGLEQLINAIGYDVRAFASAEEFVESGSIAETTCLITDLHMPGMSGLELQSHLRNEGYGTPIILVTAFPTEMHRSRALKDGATDFLAKPFDEQTLVSSLTRAIAAAA